MTELTRTEFSWLLKSCLPHAGKLRPTDVVGLHSGNGVLTVWATDNLSLGVASAYCEDLVSCWVPAKEAGDLERLVRPNRKADQDQVVRLLVMDGLHVQMGDEPGVVFETVDHGVSLEQCQSLLSQLASQPAEFQGLVFDPELLSRFAKVKRAATDRITLTGVRVTDRGGAALVTVGTRFTGAIRGMTYEPVNQEAVA